MLQKNSAEYHLLFLLGNNEAWLVDFFQTDIRLRICYFRQGTSIRSLTARASNHANLELNYWDLLYRHKSNSNFLYLRSHSSTKIYHSSRNIYKKIFFVWEKNSVKVTTKREKTHKKSRKFKIPRRIKFTILIKKIQTIQFFFYIYFMSMIKTTK